MNEQYTISESKEITLELGEAKIKVAVSVENLPLQGKAVAISRLTTMFGEIIQDLQRPRV